MPLHGPRLAALASAALLAACGTPQEQCIAREARELRTLEALAAETRANLARGYGIEQRQELREERTTCETRDENGETISYPCQEVDVEEVEVAVTLDLEAERRKLAQLEARIEEERARVALAVASCQSAYPSDRASR